MADASSLGNPFTQQRDLQAGSAIVAFHDRGVVELSGSDRLSYLDSLVSQDVASLEPGISAEALLLDPQGHIERVMRIVDDGHSTWLLVDAAQAPPLAAFLDRMTFSKDAAARDASSDFATVGFFTGGSVESLLESVTAAPNEISLIWHDPWGSVAKGGWQYAHAQGHPAGQWNYAEALVELSRIGELDKLAHASFDAWDALRIAAWRPSMATEVDATALPHEVDWLRSAVHLSKGCYRGQETVAKVHNLGHPPRRLVMLHLDGTTNELPFLGAPVTLDGAEVGHVTIAGRHFEDGPIALAVVKRSIPGDAILTVEAPSGTQPATQVVIVPTDAGRAVDVPRIPKLGRVSRTAD
jgi:folate-binding protein YgfZ